MFHWKSYECVDFHTELDKLGNIIESTCDHPGTLAITRRHKNWNARGGGTPRAAGGRV